VGMEGGERGEGRERNERGAQRHTISQGGVS
jgi:hypothetical protein